MPPPATPARRTHLPRHARPVPATSSPFPLTTPFPLPAGGPAAHRLQRALHGRALLPGRAALPPPPRPHCGLPALRPARRLPPGTSSHELPRAHTISHNLPPSRTISYELPWSPARRPPPTSQRPAASHRPPLSQEIEGLKACYNGSSLSRTARAGANGLQDIPRFNSFVLDACNALWRNRAFVDSAEPQVRLRFLSVPS